MNVYKVTSPWSVEYVAASNLMIAEKLYHKETGAQMFKAGFHGDSEIKSIERLGVLIGNCTAHADRKRRKHAK